MQRPDPTPLSSEQQEHFHREVYLVAMDLRYQSAKLPTTAKITRLSGETVGSQSEGISGSCYPPEADFLMRSRSRPNEVVNDPDVFAHLRVTHREPRTSRKWQPVPTAWNAPMR